MPRGKIKEQSEQTVDILAEQIQKAVKGLSYTSESDAAVEVFTGSAADAVTQENLLSQIGKTDNPPVKQQNFEDFFAPLTTLQDWFGKEEKNNAAKFSALQELLKNNLKDLTVFKIGSIEIDVYAVGLDTQSILTGIKTKSVET